MTIRGNDDVVVLEPDGDLCEGAACDEMERRLLELAGAGRRVVVNLGATHRLTARGLGILARAERVAAQHGGHIAVCGADRLQRWLIERTGLAGALTLLGSEADAVRALENLPRSVA